MIWQFQAERTELWQDVLLNRLRTEPFVARLESFREQAKVRAATKGLLQLT